MSQLSKATFETTYVNVAGTFADNTTRLISEGDLRQFSDDTADSFINITDSLVSTPLTGSVGSATQVPSTSIVGAYRKSGVISTAEILSGNSSPVTLVAAPGAGLVLLPYAFFFKLDYNSAAYATNTTFRVQMASVVVTADNTSLLLTTADMWVNQRMADNTGTTTTLENEEIYFTVPSGNPTAGNSPIYYTVIYSVCPTS